VDQLLKSKYRIGQKLSESPFSLTYQGSFLGTGKPVIIKIYKRGTLNSSLIKSMRQRVLSFTLINHHGVARLLDGDYGWQGFYYVREFIEGQSLQSLFDKGEKIGLEKACAIADQVLDALAAVHTKGIIHAALKPTNIFIDNQGLVKVTDFVIEGEITAALPQRIMGIMENGKYSAPEELAGEPISSAADIFAVGLILYEMVVGKRLSLGGGLAGSVRKLREPLILSKELLSSLPNYLKEIVARALERDSRLRFSTAAEFRECLERKSLLRKPLPADELVKIFESVVTQYGGEEIDQESEMLQDVGRVRLRWGKEKHRNWILLVVLAVAVALGLLYAFFLGR
jgi:serine/threonine-protein kinase